MLLSPDYQISILKVCSVQRFNKPYSKILAVSDLHLECYTSDLDWINVLPEPDPNAVLILAGDIINWKSKKKPMGLDSKVLKLLSYLSRSFAATLYVPGNHEFWGSRPGHHETDTPQKLKSLITDVGIDNVFILNDESITLNNEAVIIGATLWTDMDKGCPLFKLKVMRKSGVKSVLSDFNQIYFRYPDGNFNRLTPWSLRYLHQTSVSFIRSELENPDYEGMSKIVVTHHLPSLSLIKQSYQGDWKNPIYASSLEYLMTGADYWVHGHSHGQNDFTCPYTEAKVFANQSGYYPSRLEHGYDRNKVLAVSGSLYIKPKNNTMESCCYED